MMFLLFLLTGTHCEQARRLRQRRTCWGGIHADIDQCEMFFLTFPDMERYHYRIPSCVTTWTGTFSLWYLGLLQVRALHRRLPDLKERAWMNDLTTGCVHLTSWNESGCMTMIVSWQCGIVG